MADQLNVLVICGSLRKGPYTAALARTLPELAPAEMKLKEAPPYDGRMAPKQRAHGRKCEADTFQHARKAPSLRRTSGPKHRLRAGVGLGEVS